MEYKWGFKMCEEYFQNELNDKNFLVFNIHIITIIPSLVGVSQCFISQTRNL
jgi:hypothetical protein